MFSVSVFSSQKEIVLHFVRRSLTENEHSCRIWEGTRFHRQRNPWVTIRVNNGKVNKGTITWKRQRSKAESDLWLAMWSAANNSSHLPGLWQTNNHVYEWTNLWMHSSLSCPSLYFSNSTRMTRESNPGGGEIFRAHPNRSWGSPSLLYDRLRVIRGDTAVGAWRWPPPPPSSAEVQERVGLYFSSHPPCLHALFWGELYFSLPLPLNSKLYLVCILYSSVYRAYLLLASSSMGIGRCGVSRERTSSTAPVFLLWLYGPCRTLATFRITFQAPISLAVFHQPLTPIIFSSFQTPSNRLPLSRLSNRSFPFWDNLKHILHSSLFWHHSHIS